MMKRAACGFSRQEKEEKSFLNCISAILSLIRGLTKTVVGCVA